MASASDVYVKGVYKRFSYFATWLPNTKVALGDVGTKEGKHFRRLTSLKELGIRFRARAGADPVDFTYTSESGVTVHAGGAGKAAVGAVGPLGQADVVIRFSKGGAFLFQAFGCRVHEIEDQVRLGKAVLRSWQKKDFDRDWSVVVTVVKAGRATILVSNSRSAALELTASGPLAATNLASLGAGLAVKAQRGDVTQFLAAKGLTPLFQLKGLNQRLLDRLLRRPQTIYFGGKAAKDQAGVAPDEDVLEVVKPA